MRNMHIVYSHVLQKGRHLEKPDEGGALGAKLCGCMLNTQVMHL